MAQDSPEKMIVRRKTVRYLHSEINARYQMDHLRSLPEVKSENLLKDVSPEHIERLKELFTTTIYPEVDNRQDRDKSFESLVKMLKNPRKLATLIPSIPKIMFTYASQFPAALKTGLNTVMAYTLSNRLEDMMVNNMMEVLRENNVKINEKLKITPEFYHKAYTGVPIHDGKKMIGYSSVVMKSGKSKNLVNSTWEIMDEVQSSLKNKDRQLKQNGRPTQHEDDIEAIGYGKSVLDKVKETFFLSTPEVMDRMIRISYIAEMEYLDRMYSMK